MESNNFHLYSSGQYESIQRNIHTEIEPVVEFEEVQVKLEMINDSNDDDVAKRELKHGQGVEIEEMAKSEFNNSTNDKSCTIVNPTDSLTTMTFHLEHEETDNVASENALQFLAINLKDYPDALTKSQLPEAKKKKDAALSTLVELYGQNFGELITVKTLLKKINNMKTRLKKKTDKKQIGNRPIKLCAWEKTLYRLIDGDRNPAISKIPVKLDIQKNLLDQGMEKHTLPLVEKRPLPTNSTEDYSPSHSQEIFSPTRKRIFLGRKSEILNEHESEETRGLTNSELQRLVLIEQLQAARAQKLAAIAQQSAAIAQEYFYKSSTIQK